MAGVMPAQFSEPQFPVAKAQVNVESPAGMVLVTASTVPVSADCCSPVFQFVLIVTSLYGLKRICAEAVALNSATRTTAKTTTAWEREANRIRSCLPRIVIQAS